MTIHDLKVWTQFFWDIKAGRKTFEVRINDRGFKVGDELLLREWEAIPQRYTGHTVWAKVTYLCDIRSIMNEDMVGMSIEVMGERKPMDNSLPPCSDCPRDESSCKFKRLTCTRPEKVIE